MHRFTQKHTFRSRTDVDCGGLGTHLFITNPCHALLGSWCSRHPVICVLESCNLFLKAYVSFYFAGWIPTCIRSTLPRVAIFLSTLGSSALSLPTALTTEDRSIHTTSHHRLCPIPASPCLRCRPCTPPADPLTPHRLTPATTTTSSRAHPWKAHLSSFRWTHAWWVPCSVAGAGTSAVPAAARRCPVVCQGSARRAWAAAASALTTMTPNRGRAQPPLPTGGSIR